MLWLYWSLYILPLSNGVLWGVKMVEDGRAEATKFSGIQFRWLPIPSNSSHSLLPSNICSILSDIGWCWAVRLLCWENWEKTQSAVPTNFLQFLPLSEFLPCPRGCLNAKDVVLGTPGELTLGRWRYRTPWARCIRIKSQKNNHKIH